MAVFNSSQFLTKINDLGGPARTNKFDVEIYVPPTVQDYFKEQSGFTYDNSYLSILCESADIPYKSLATSEHRINGFTEFRPHSVNFDRQTNLNFILNDGLDSVTGGNKGHYIKAFFDYWMDYIIDSNNYDTSNFYLRYYEDYVGEIRITPRRMDLKEISTTTMTGVFPTNVGSLKYTQRDGNASTLGVTLAFDRWTVKYN